MSMNNLGWASQHWPIVYEFSLYRRLIKSMDSHIESDLTKFATDLNVEAELIEDAESRDDFYLSHDDDFQDFEYLRQLSLRSMFVAAVSLFEYRFFCICNAAQRRSGNPIGIADLGHFSLDRAKTYLSKLGVDVPTDAVEWNDAQRFYRLRNAIVHQGGFIPAKGDLKDFAMQKGITNQRFRTGQPPKQSTDSDMRLELTQEFCEQALDTCMQLLIRVAHSVVEVP